MSFPKDANGDWDWRNDPERTPRLVREKRKAKVSFLVIRVESTGLRQTTALVCTARGCEVQPVTLDTYPPSPRGERLRALRVELGLGLREAARALGVKASELSGLEFGRARLADEAEWDRAEAMIREAKRTDSK